MMHRNRIDAGKSYSPSKGRKFLSRSAMGRSPRKCLPNSSVILSRGQRHGKGISSNGGASSNMKVVVRVRPLNEKEIQGNARQILKVVDEKMLVFDPKEEDSDFFFHGSKQKGRDMLKKQHKHSEFLFDKVFGPNVTNEEVFEGSSMSIVSSVLDGFNCSVFVYGATGAGKTYTMLGTEENPGITYRTMVELFRQVEAQTNEKDFDIRVSYLEVYNENVQDLLHPSGPLHLREDGAGVMVSGLKMEQILNPQKMFELLEKGNKNRSQHPTDANAESSRSHAVFQVFIKMTTKTTGQAKFVKLSMIDLAGSERGAATGCAGARFKEGSNINKSLLALGNCINALADGLRHIPYRDSKLTRILKDSLGGNCQTVMIANVSPALSTYEDTHNTLKYARRAKAIKVKITRNILTVQLHVSSYIKMNEDLQQQLSRVKEDNLKLQEKCLKLEEENDNLKKLSPPGQAQALLNEESFKSQPLKPDNSGTCESMKENEKIFNNLVEKAEQLFNDKASVQKRYLNLDSNEKVVQIQMYLKERAFDRVSALSSTPGRRDATKVRIDRALGQFSGRLASANQDQEMLSYEKSVIDQQLKNLEEEAKKINLSKEFLSHIKCLQLKLSNKELCAQREHSDKLIQILSRGLENQDLLINEISEVFRQYYSLLKGHGHMTDQMLEKHSMLMRRLENIKSVNWISENIASSGETNTGNQSAALQAISKVSSKLSFESEMSPVYDPPDIVSGSPRHFELSKDDCFEQVQRADPRDNNLVPEKSSDSNNISENKQDQMSPCNLIANSILFNSSLTKMHVENSGMLSPSLQPVGKGQSNNSQAASAVSQKMDTASMVDSLGMLDARVESLLNTSLPQSAEEKLFYPTVTEQGALSSLNSTFDAAEKFSSTVNKDSGFSELVPKCDNLNVTFEKSSRSPSPHPNGDVLNSTFSIDNTCESSKQRQHVTDSTNTHPCANVPKIKTASHKTVCPTTVPSITLPQSGSKVGKTKSSPLFAVPSVPLSKSRGAIGKVQEDPSKRKGILHSPAIAKPHSFSSKPVGVALKGKTPPNKGKGIWNKENKNVMSSLAATLKSNASGKLSTSGAAVRKLAMKNDMYRKVVNDTYTKELPK